ncbi:MAG TPA: serine/threonine-protein kinase [Myxococcales bacterium]|nr:serine/threonine-protein kinase [Myxococcales bacterium]
MVQRDELDRQGSCRSLFAILREKGLIDERVARTLKPPVNGGDRPGDVTPHTPTVVLAPPDDTPSPKRPGSHSSIAGTRAARKRPPKVDAAAVDARNILGPYILVSEVGRGGMGRVYRAWDENVGRFVALKVIDTEDQADRERFVREAQIAGRLHHPAIATVFNAGEEDLLGYIAMQFIDGWPIDAQPLPLVTALSLIRDAAAALSYAHGQGVVHRDVKPGNLMVDGKGSVFLTDFGLAKEVVANDATQLSITGTTFGTPQYMSPEQARGEHKKIDGRSDVYSLGATLYALLARRPPFKSTNLATLLLEVLDKHPPPLSRFNKEISPELRMLVERAMSKDPARRFPSMAAFAEALDRIIREGRYAGRYGLVRSIARRWLPRVAVAAVLGAALWVGIPIVFAPPKAAVVDPTPRLYASAVAELRTLEGQPLTPEERRERVGQQVLRPLAEVLAKKPGDLKARAAKVRALYAAGDRTLPELDGDDYRFALVRALLELEKALAEPCPMPALEAPSFEWERPPEAWPAALVSAIDAVTRASVASDLAEEYDRDRPLIKGLSALTSGQGGRDADGLRQNALPVFQAAWCRAAYLDRRFADVREAAESKGRREQFGARLALASGSAAELQALLAGAGDDAPLVHAALARMEGAGAVEGHVEAGLKGAAPERQAALISARLRAQSLAGADEEKEYRRAIGLAGDRPSTWPGRLAAVELRIGLGARLLRSRGDGRPPLEEAARLADELAQKSPAWAPPRLLGAQARLRLGRLDEARAELNRLGAERKGPRACVTAAAIELAIAGRERKAGGAYAEAAKAALQEALAAPGDPVEARMLAGAATVLLAQHTADEGRDEAELVRKAVASLSAAVDSVPGYGEARYHRAWARFLLADVVRREGGKARTEWEAAREDADAALAAAPDFLAARNLRGIVNFSLERDAEAVADWRALIQADASWDTPELQSWIQRAEKRLNKP